MIESFKILAICATRPLLAGAMLIAVAACVTTPEPQVGTASTAVNPDLGQAAFSPELATDYQLRPADKITITVVREPDLSFDEISIAADGTVSMPLAGSVSAASLTTGELAVVLQDSLKAAGLKRPLVSVNILEYSSHVVTVEGGVEEPGVYGFLPGSRLSSAIALANGPSRVSKLSEVVVFRQTDEGTAIALFDYQAVRQGRMVDPVIQPGDRVVVGISGLSQFWQDLIRALPAFGLFTNI